MAEKDPNAPHVPNTPRTDPTHTPDKLTERDTDTGDRSSDKSDRDPMRANQPDEPGKRSGR